MYSAEALTFCKFIVAITHMRDYNDRKLAEQSKGINLILVCITHVIVAFLFCSPSFFFYCLFCISLWQ